MKITIDVAMETGNIEVTSDEPLSLFVTSKILLEVAKNCVHVLNEEGNKDINEIGHRKAKSD